MERLQPKHVYFGKYEKTLRLFAHITDNNTTPRRALKEFWGNSYKLQSDISDWSKPQQCFIPPKGKTPLIQAKQKAAQEDNARLASLQTAIKGILESTPCYSIDDICTAYKASLGIVCKAPTNKQTLLEYAVYYRNLWKSGNVRNYKVKSSNYRLYDKFINKLNGTKSGVVMPWAKQMKEFANMPIADINNDTYKKIALFVAEYTTPYHKEQHTDMAYMETVKIFRAVVYHYQKSKGNTDFKFTYIALGKDAPQPESKNVHQTLTDEQLKQLWGFDVTLIKPRVPKETKQLYLDTCLLMYGELSRPRDIIDMHIEDIKTEKDGSMFWRYCPKKKANVKENNPTAKFAEIQIHPDCVSVIKKYKGKRTKGYLLPFKINQKAETKNRDTDVMHVREKIRKFMLEIAEYYNWDIEHFAMYTLRHTSITNAEKRGLKPNEIAIAAKTSVRQITQTYANYNEISRKINISVL